MFIVDSPEYKKISAIVSKWLALRDNSDSDYKNWLLEPSDEDDFFPRYVMKMMREINEIMPAPCLDEIKSNEINAMGHVDYFKKFVLYCTRTYQKYEHKSAEGKI